MENANILRAVSTSSGSARPEHLSLKMTKDLYIQRKEGVEERGNRELHNTGVAQSQLGFLCSSNTSRSVPTMCPTPREMLERPSPGRPGAATLPWGWCRARRVHQVAVKESEKGS